MTIRPAGPSDADAIWSILEPTIRAGETYTLPREMDREQALAYWFSPDHAVFVAEDDGEVLGTYYRSCKSKRWRRPRGQLRLYDGSPSFRTWSGDRDVRTFAGVRPHSRFPRHAVQLCRQQQ